MNDRSSRRSPSPTAFPEVNMIIKKLLSGVQTALGNYFIGMYIHGSLAYGDFNPDSSDIDFLVVTDGYLPGEIFAALKDMHVRLFTGGGAWSQKLEGAYIPIDDLRRYNPSHDPIPWLGVDGHFARESLGSDWIIQSWILREKGIIVAGPPLKPLIDPVNADDLRKAVRASLREWWTPPFPSPKQFESCEYQVYAILTMCRSLYVIDHGRVASKPEAARWAKSKLGVSWAKLIEEAAMWQYGDKFSRFEETMGFIFYTLETSRK